MKRSRSTYIPSDFYCCICGSKNIPVYRSKGQEREAGHLKKLYCYTCEKEQNCVEIKQNTNSYTLSDFLIEFEYGNFDEDGNRKRKYGDLRNDIHNGIAERQKEIIFNGRSPWIR